MPVYDLHCHSTCSDGRLTPAELVARAAQKGVTHLALTDHDTLAGLPDAMEAATTWDINLITGVEFSVSWQRKPLHILGLDFDAAAPGLVALVETLQIIREQRAEKIALKLEKKGVKEPLEHARRFAGGKLITRPHFAHCLVEQGFAKDFESAFRYYLGQGKPGFVATQWVELETVVGEIRRAGGRAVIAHPRRYRLTHSWMRKLLKLFKECGGEGVEVVTGGCSPGDIEAMAQLAVRFELMASAGSDFHDPANPWVELGRLASLPGTLSPIWSQFDDQASNRVSEQIR